MAGVSNGAFLPLLPAAPLPGSGWTAKVYAHTDLFDYARGRNPNPIAQLYRFQQVTWSPQISEVGAGSVTLHSRDPIWSYALADGRPATALRDYDNLWVLFKDGQWRGEFLARKVTNPLLTDSEQAGKTITIGGPGAGQVLDQARVMSPYFPRTPPKGKIGHYVFKNVPVMAAWLQLLWEAQRRGTIPYVHCRFSATRDTAGRPWEDTPPAKPKNTATTNLGDVLFDYDSSALSTAGQAAVKKIADKLAKVTNPVVSIVGHTDAAGSRAYNLQKGLDRANTVRNAILAIRPLAHVDASSKGETQPVASNRTAAGRRKNRRVVVTYQTGAATPDTEYLPDEGTKLLDLLTQLTSGQSTADSRGPIHCEWMMRKGFELHVMGQFGVDRSSKVVFHEGSTYLASRTIEYDRSEIANLIAVRNDVGAYKVATHPGSIARWGQREMFTHLDAAGYSDKLHAQIANTQKIAYGDQQITNTITIRPGPGRTPFVDFDLGDYIGIVNTRGRLPSTIDRQRVIAITVTVDADNNETYELMVSSAQTTQVGWLKMQVESLINRKRGIRPFFTEDQPTGLRPGDLWTPPAFKAT